MNDIIMLAKEADIAVPVSEIIVVLLALSVCLLLRLNSAGLIISYLFALHMGWLFCERELLDKMPGLQRYAAFYFLFGAAVLLLAIFGIMQERSRNKE